VGEELRSSIWVKLRFNGSILRNPLVQAQNLRCSLIQGIGENLGSSLHCKEVIAHFYTRADDADLSTWVTKSADQSTDVTTSVYDIVKQVD